MGYINVGLSLLQGQGCDWLNGWIWYMIVIKIWFWSQDIDS